MFLQTVSSLRDLGRLYGIASVLVRYGFGDLVRRMGLADALERAGRALHWDDAHDYAHLPPPARVRHALEALGPTFVKLGQVLATRVDLFEPEWIAEFAQLQDHALPAPQEAVLAQLSEDLGGPPEQSFAQFDPQPLAAASLAQVYAARLRDGQPVVVKVRRPGIRPLVEADLRLLQRLAAAAEAQAPALRAFQPQRLVREFSQSLRREMDFAAEARHARRVAENFAGYVDHMEAAGTPPGAGFAEPPIVIPRVFWECERVCVQERVEGIPGTRLDQVDAAGLDRSLLARRGAAAVLKMIVEDGFFHADPHPGNVFYLPGHRIAFIDFGMVGRLSEARRQELIRLLLGLVELDAEAVADVLMNWTQSESVDEDALKADIDSFIDHYHGVPLRSLQFGAMLNEVLAILRQHQLALPGDLSLLIKAFITLEGMGRELDPGFEMAEQARPILERLVQRQYAPDAMLKRGWRSMRDALSLLGGLPADLKHLIRAARRGRLEIHVDVPDVKHLGHQLDRAVSRLVVGVVVAALIIGSSIVMTVPGGPKLLGLPLFGLMGFAGAVAGSLWLLASIWSSNRAERLQRR